MKSITIRGLRSDIAELEAAITKDGPDHWAHAMRSRWLGEYRAELATR